MFYTIYQITNLINGKTYIGKHQTKDLNDGYLGSGKLIKRAIEKYGKENFYKTILCIFTTEEEMDAKEKELVVLSENSYNLCEGGKGGFGYLNKNGLNNSNKNRDEINQRVRIKLSGRKNPSNSVRLKRLHQDGFFKEQNRLAFLGKTHTDEWRNNHSAFMKGRLVGSLNPSFGTCWITNGTENKKIKKEDLDKYQELGYNKGRKFAAEALR